MSNPDSFAHTHSAGHVIGGGRYSLHVTLGDSDLVWLAQDEVEQRLAAIRFFPGELRRDPRAWDVVKRRVGGLQKVNHSAVSRVLEWYEAEGVEPFVAFEYVEGQALAGRNAALPWDKLAPVARDVAAALHALHSQGVVHRGVEPGNIIITESGAKLVNPVVTGVLKDPLLCPSALQKPAELRWCSAQQLAGEAPSPADDFYGFGATLFELLTGTPLFVNSRTLLTDLRNGPPRDLTARLAAVPHVPPGVAEFVIACLLREPGQRPTDVPSCLQAESVSAVEHNGEDVPPAPEMEPLAGTVVARLEPMPETAIMRTAPHPVRRRSKTPLLVAVVVLVCATVSGGAWMLKQGQAEKERLAAAREEQDRETERLKQEAEQQRLQAAMLEEKKQQEEQAAAELKRRELEAARKAAAEKERREAHSSVQMVAEKTSKPAGSKPLPSSTTEEGFVTIFNGEDLSGWQGPSNVWSVLDGCITAQLPSEAPRHKRSYLVWKNGTVEDFELRFSYRFRLLRGNKQPNGGLVYRAVTNNTPELSAYQFDVVPDAKNVGAVNEDKKRYRLAGYGESAVAGLNEKTQVIAQVGDTNKLSSVRPEDWNTAVIVARGNHLTHYINGELSADLIDENLKRIHKSGMLALEVYARNTNNSATFLQFRDIKFKRLEKSSTMLSASR